MVQTIKEFMDEMKMLRKEMYLHGEKADTKLVASWLDRLVICMEKVGPTLDMMSTELDELATAEPLAQMRSRSSKPARSARKPAKKSFGKSSAKFKRHARRSKKISGRSKKAGKSRRR